MLSISRLLFDTIYHEEHCLKTLLQQLHFLFNVSGIPSKYGLAARPETFYLKAVPIHWDKMSH